MYRRIRIIRQLEQVSEPYRMMFMKLKEHTGAAHITAFLQRRKKKFKILKYCFVGGHRLFANFCFSWCFLGPNPRQKRGI